MTKIQRLKHFDTFAQKKKNYINIYPKVTLNSSRLYFSKFLFKFIFFIYILNVTQLVNSKYVNKDISKKGLYTNNGLKILIYSEGNGRNPKWGDFVKINYVIYLFKHNKVEKIDSTYERHTPFTFRHGSAQIIMGIEEAIHNMKQGEKRRIIIPDNLGYITSNLGPLPPSNSKREILFKNNKEKPFQNDVLLLLDIELIDIFEII